MKSVYALIPAALLAGTVLSASVEARGLEDPTVHSEHLSSKQKYFKTVAAKKPVKIKMVRSSKARKLVSDAERPISRTAKSRKIAAAKTRKHIAVAVPKQAGERPHKLARVDATSSKIKRRKLATFDGTSMKIRTRKPVAVASLKQIDMPELAEIKTGNNENITATSLPKVLRSGPRGLRKLIPEDKNVVSGEALRVTEVSDIKVIEVIREMAPSYGVPTWFALRIANVESGYNPYARGSAGEIGIYQLKCPTARGMGFEGDCNDLTDIRTNVRWGLKHLSLAIESSGGNLRLAASKHNGGLGRKSLVHSYIAKVF